MDFVSRYKQECLLKGTSPLHTIVSSLADAVLNFKFLRVPVSEWSPLLAALRDNFSLKKICVTINVLDLESRNPTHMAKLRHLHQFTQSLVVHLSNSQVLTNLSLVGIPFNVADVEYLTKGINESNSIQHLCLAESRISDEGLVKIIEALKAKPNIAWLDLRSCGLSCKAGKLLASLVSFQSAARENAAQKACLSVEDHNLDWIRGLRRISLSGNALCDGAGDLALALHEDRWIKAVDLQFCNLKDIHLNHLIRAAENGHSLVHLDTSNNEGLNSKLVKRLKDCLKENALKHPFVVIQPIAMSVSDRGLSSQLKQKVLRRDSSSKEIKLKTKTENLPFNVRRVTKDKAKESNDASHSQFTSPVKDIFAGRMLPNVADIQITEIHDEVGSVKARIAMLEEKVRELEHKRPPVSKKILGSGKVVEGGAFSGPLTRSVLICMERLQGVLGELKMTSAALHHCEEKDRNQEIQIILDAVYVAIRQLEPQANCFRSEKYKSMAIGNRLPRRTTKTASCKVEKTDKYCENPSGFFHKNSRGRSVIPNRENATISEAEHLTNLSGTRSLVESVFHEHSPQNDSSQIVQDDNSRISLQEFSGNITSSLRLNSLKSLQTNLEELRQQLYAKNDDDASSLKRNLASELTADRSLCDLTSQEDGTSRYSTHFDSFCTSSASERPMSYSSTQVRSEIQNNYFPPSEVKQSNNVRLEKENILSPMSSSIDLSSIVNLLGNFSVDDIGSSTLTPP